MDPKELGERSAAAMPIAGHIVNSPGLTKREVAALVAMHGQLAAGAADIEEVPAVAVAYADRLMSELAKEPKA